MVLSVLLVHELARATLAYRFGRSSQITLSTTGGHTDFIGAPLDRRRSTWCAVIGALANLTVAAITALIANQPLPSGAASWLQECAIVHAAWGSLQLLPLVPSHVSTLVVRGRSLALEWIHESAAALVLLFAWLAFGSGQPASLAALIGLWLVDGVKVLRIAGRENADSRMGVDALVRNAHQMIESDEVVRAIFYVHAGLAIVRSERLRNALYRALARAAVARGDSRLLDTALLALPEDELDLPLVVDALLGWNQDDAAIELLERARALGQRSRDTTRRLIDLRFRKGQLETVRELARADTALLSAEDCAAIERALATGV